MVSSLVHSDKIGGIQHVTEETEDGLAKTARQYKDVD